MLTKTPRMALFVTVAAAFVLAACGGGTGGNDPVSLSSLAAGSVSQDAAIKAGETFSFTVVAESPDNALSQLSWKMQASGNAPALAVSNLDCSAAEKTDVPRQNGLVSSVWKCTINGATPGLVENDAVYTFTANATNTKGGTSSTSSVLKVAATPSDAQTPKVEIDAPTNVNGGDVQDLACNAASRFPSTSPAAAYTYAWSSSAIDGQQVSFDSRSTQKVKATFPRLVTKSTMIVTCNATDSFGNVGQASVPVEVSQSVLGVSITGTASGTSGSSIALTCSVAAAGGNSASYTYKWSSFAVSGGNLVFDSSTRNVVSVMLPTVTTPTSIVATCEATDASGVKGQGSVAVSVTPVVTPPASGT